MVDEVKITIVFVVLFAIISGSSVSAAICCNQNPSIPLPKQPSLAPIVRANLLSTTCVRTSEYSPLGITCPQGKEIVIIKAWYGVLDPAICSANFSSRITCSGDVTAIVATKCSYSNQCVLSGYNALFGADPCPSQLKGLDVDYICQTATCHKSAENSNFIMSCPAGSEVVINNAVWYGIIDPSVCFPSQCASNVTANVISICQNLNLCAVNGSVSLFGDPCPGTPKHLAIDYGCQTVPGLLQAFGCEYSSLTISCPSQQINVREAFYGNVGPAGTCNIGGSSAYTCFGNATAVVQGYCEGQSSCSIPVGNGLIGDPCPGTYKYLTVNYYCRSLIIPTAQN